MVLLHHRFAQTRHPAHPLSVPAPLPRHRSLLVTCTQQQQQRRVRLQWQMRSMAEQVLSIH